MKVLIFDTETTGFDSPEVIEAAWLEIESVETLTVLSTYEQRFEPSIPIELGALATHHIMDEDLIGCPSSSDFELPPDVDYLVGHNIDYDWKVSGSPDIPRICTLALCKHLFPKLDSHTQSAMLYHLERSTAREDLKHAHSALADVRICLKILDHILEKLDDISNWEDLWKASESARIPTIMPFGKHKGVPIKSIPGDYKRWLRGQSNIDPYLLQAIQ